MHVRKKANLIDITIKYLIENDDNCDNCSNNTSNNTTYPCCNSCPKVPLLRNSWNTFNPILGGVDVVSYFQINAITPQTVNTNYQPLMGDKRFQTTYRGYTYYFSDCINLQIFNKNPNKYIPQFGGYCSFGMAYEFCLPDKVYNILSKLLPNLSNGYVWSSRCLGPTASRDCWLIINDKLFLFYLNGARSSFVSNLKQSYLIAKLRWNAFKKIFKTKNVNPHVIRSTSSFPNQADAVNQTLIW